MFSFSCVVRHGSFYFGTVLPICVLLICNMTSLVMVMRKLYRRDTKFENARANSKDLKRQVITALSCTVLFGLTWLFGVLAIGYLRLLFQIIFCILSSLQGFFIFLFYIVKNPSDRSKWVQLLCPPREARKTNKATSISKNKTQGNFI